MLAQQRYNTILELLEANGIVHTADLVNKMKVSSETIRKDLDFLEQEKRLARVHGGAISLKNEKTLDYASEYISLQTRNTQHMEQKAAITNYAASLVKEHQVVALDYGSTSQMMAIALKKNFRSLTVITNSVQNAMILAECPDFTIILTGGILNKDEFTLGNDFTPMLDFLHIDILFMTVTGIDPAIGCTDQCLREAKIQNQMRQTASQTIILADSSKFGKGSLVKVCALRDVNTIITDRDLSASMEQDIKNAGATLIIVP
ncbi:MAG: DeoR/GlpR family DNA-binding transcription regulator [Ruthenibacterium sp.]